MKNIFKKVTIGAVGLSLVFSLTACGDSYKKNIEKVSEQIDANNEQSLNVDWQNKEQVEIYIEETKAIYQSILDLDASKKNSEAQAILNEGAAKMLIYLDILPEYLAIEDKNTEEARAKHAEAINEFSDAVSKIAEGKEALGISAEEKAKVALENQNFVEKQEEEKQTKEVPDETTGDLADYEASQQSIKE